MAASRTSSSFPSDGSGNPNHCWRRGRIPEFAKGLGSSRDRNTHLESKLLFANPQRKVGAALIEKPMN